MAEARAERRLAAILAADIVGYSRLIEQDAASRRYRLGQEVYVLGTLAARRHGLLEQAAESLRRLSGATGDTSFVSARHGDFVLCLHREEGSHPVRTHALQTSSNLYAQVVWLRRNLVDEQQPPIGRHVRGGHDANATLGAEGLPRSIATPAPAASARS